MTSARLPEVPDPAALLGCCLVTQSHPHLGQSLVEAGMKAVLVRREAAPEVDGLGRRASGRRPAEGPNPDQERRPGPFHSSARLRALAWTL